MRTLTVLGGVGLVVACTFALLELRSARASSPVAAPPPPVAATIQPLPVRPLPPETILPPAAIPRPAVDARPDIRQAIETAAPSLPTQRDVDRYVAELEARARRNHQLTALEVEPGLAAIRRLGADLDPRREAELEGEFIHKMNRLAAELNAGVR